MTRATENLCYALITIAVMGTILIITITSPPIRDKFPNNQPEIYQSKCTIT